MGGDVKTWLKFILRHESQHFTTAKALFSIELVRKLGSIVYKYVKF